MESINENEDESPKIDLDEVTDLFAKVKPLVANVTDEMEFVRIVQKGATEKIVHTYFTGPIQYSDEELTRLIDHAIACINDIMPDRIPYVAEYKNNGWTMRKLKKRKKINRE